VLVEQRAHQATKGDHVGQVGEEEEDRGGEDLREGAPAAESVAEVGGVVRHAALDVVHQAAEQAPGVLQPLQVYAHLRRHDRRVAFDAVVLRQSTFDTIKWTAKQVTYKGNVLELCYGILLFGERNEKKQLQLDNFCENIRPLQFCRWVPELDLCATWQAGCK